MTADVERLTVTQLDWRGGLQDALNDGTFPSDDHGPMSWSDWLGEIIVSYACKRPPRASALVGNEVRAAFEEAQAIAETVAARLDGADVRQGRIAALGIAKAIARAAGRSEEKGRIASQPPSSPEQEEVEQPQWGAFGHGLKGCRRCGRLSPDDAAACTDCPGYDDRVESGPPSDVERAMRAARKRGLLDPAVVGDEQEQIKQIQMIAAEPFGEGGWAMDEEALRQSLKKIEELARGGEACAMHSSGET